MNTLTKVAWGIFAFYFLLGSVIIAAALHDLAKGIPETKGLTRAVAVGCGVALLVFAAILVLSTYFRSRLGLWLSLLVMGAELLLVVIGLARQFR
jgi:hypothetical protein